MKTNYSKADIEKFTDSLIVRGWVKTTVEGIDQYQTQDGNGLDWACITILGRTVRTVRSWNHQSVAGLNEARVTALNLR